MRICTRLCHNRLVDYCLKAHIFGGSAVKSAIESADSIAESADSTTDSVIVSRLTLLNIGRLLQSADEKSAQWVRAFNQTPQSKDNMLTKSVLQSS